ncbi:MAG TPA: DUF3718 domain-containing protein [Aliidiomarina sp.]|nr:DUF3718 domain-containing protein [Aliidiomarina sp.]
MRVFSFTLFFFVAAVMTVLPTKSYANSEIAEGLCAAIVADDRQRMRTILSNNNMRLRNVFNGVRCNGYSMLQFAITAEAIDVGEMLIRQLPIRIIEEDEVNGQNILQWAESAGYGSSPVLQVVRDRLNG